MGRRGRRRRRESNQSGSTSPRLPGNVQRTIDRWDRLLPTLQKNPDLAREIDARRRRLTDVLAPVDAVAMLGQLVLAEVPNSADSYVESEHSGAAYIIELAAAVLAVRPDRSGSGPDAQAIDAKTLTPAKDLAWEIALLEGLRRYRRADATSEDESLGGAQGRAAISNLMIRGPGWPWQEHALLTDLFGAFASDLKNVLGFDAAEGVAAGEAAIELVNRQLNDHRATAHEHVEDALEWAKTALAGWEDKPPRPIRDQALTAVWALMQTGEAMIIGAGDLAEQASISIAAAGSYLAALTTPFGQRGDLFAIAERIRYAPFLELGEERYFLVVPGHDLWALRGIFEQALKTDRYTAHRGAWLERRSVEILTTALQPDESQTSIALLRPDGRTNIGEIDGLLRFGDTALVVEAKSATMRPRARRGGPALIQHLKATLTKASEQVETAQKVLGGDLDGTLRAAEGQTITLPEPLREIHPILVTLDDLSAVAPTVWEIAGSAVLPEGRTIPWIVTLHELDLLCRTVESPIQMIHFLRARSRLNQLGGRVASDELDWWMLYLKTSLYFEGDTDRRVRVFSQTDDLDAWVLYEHGDREQPAPKPRQALDEASRRLIEVLAAERPPGWVAAGCSLLSASSKSRKALAGELAAARIRARERDNIQRGTQGFGEGPEPMLICWIVAPDTEAPVLSEILETYVAERVEEFGLQRVLGLGLTVSSERPYDALLVLERSSWSNPDDR
jgi:hypothetical protein